MIALQRTVYDQRQPQRPENVLRQRDRRHGKNDAIQMPNIVAS